MRRLFSVHARDSERLACDLLHARISKRACSASRARRFSSLPLLCAPRLDEIPCRIEGRRVRKKTCPERRQRADAPPAPAIGSAHLEEPFSRTSGKSVVR